MRINKNMLLHPAVFSAVSGLELSMSKDHHQCKLSFHTSLYITYLSFFFSKHELLDPHYS